MDTDAIETLIRGTGRMPTILLFSPDMDFCMSLRLLLQNRYHVITTTDAKMLLLSVQTFQPDLVIVDSVPSDVMRRRFEVMKHDKPEIRIIVFSVSHPAVASKESQRGIDALIAKPIEIGELTSNIEHLIGRPKAA